MSDQVAVHGIRARGFHGVLASERELGQPFEVDVTLDLDTAPAAATDDLALTVDYAEVATAVVEIVSGPAFDLIETLANRIAQRVLEFPGVQAVEVVVHKPHAPVPVVFSDVTVRVRRSRV